jgi:hypothetical protein
LSDLDYLHHLAAITHHLAILQQLRPNPTLQKVFEEIEKVLKASALSDTK